VRRKRRASSRRIGGLAVAPLVAPLPAILAATLVTGDRIAREKTVTLEDGEDVNLTFQDTVDDAVRAKEYLTDLGTLELGNDSPSERNLGRSPCSGLKAVDPPPCRLRVVLGDVPADAVDVPQGQR